MERKALRIRRCEQPTMGLPIRKAPGTQGVPSNHQTLAYFGHQCPLEHVGTLDGRIWLAYNARK